MITINIRRGNGDNDNDINTGYNSFESNNYTDNNDNTKDKMIIKKILLAPLSL